MQETAQILPRCQRCALPLQHGQVELCEICEDHPPMFDHGVAALDYSLPWSSVLAQLKFQQDPALASALANLMLSSIVHRWQLKPRPGLPALQRLRAGAPSLIVPVPLSSQRLQERGYNQAALLAHQLGKQLHLPVNTNLLTKHRHTPRLMSLHAQERQQRIRGAFTVAQASQQGLKNRHVAVVDDILTTGATLNEISRVLWQAGAREISVWVVARTPRPRQTPP
jgi:ComF family protein